MDRVHPFGGSRKLFGFQNNRTNNAWLAAIIKSSSDAIISKMLDGTITSWNPAAEHMFGYSEAEMLHTSVRQLVPERLHAEEARIMSAMKVGDLVPLFETKRTHRNGNELPVAMTVSPILNERGEVMGASSICRDISGELESRRQIEESESRFHTLADNMSQLAWMADAEGSTFWYNKRWFEFTGTTLEEVIGWGWTSLHHPDHVDRVVSKMQHCWTTGEPWEDTFPLRGANGTFRWFLSRALPVFDTDGKIQRWFGTNTDITDEIDRQDQIKFLMRELQHRSKNMLALVQGIARQTIGAESRHFLNSFNERITALSLSQDLLMESGWRGTNIRELIASQLGHVENEIDNRIHLSGPDTRINAGCSQTLGIALHELATNAQKYGALSNETGEVDINWTVNSTAGDEGPVFEIHWKERGGPVVKSPARNGFGSTVLNRMCRSAFSGDVVLDFAPDGLFWSLKSAPGRGLDRGDKPEG